MFFLLLRFLLKDRSRPALGMRKLKQLEDTLKETPPDEDHWSYLIDLFISEGGNFIRNYLWTRFKEENEPEKKMIWAGYLTRLLMPAGIDYYLKSLIKSGIVPKNTGEQNPLYYLKKAKYIFPVLDIIKSSKDLPTHYNHEQNLRNVAFRVLQEIGLSPDQYESANRKVKQWLYRESLYRKLKTKSAASPEIINMISFFWESVTKQHYIDLGTNLALSEALRIYETISPF